MSTTPGDGPQPRRLRPHEVPMRLFGEDTSPEVEQYLLAAYRRMSGGEKLARVRALNRATIALSLANIRQQHPDADERELLLHLAVRRYGTNFVREYLGWDVSGKGMALIVPEPLATLVRVTAALERLGLIYCIGGSFASSFYGVPRATNDVDLVVALRSEHVASLVAALEHDFMIDPQAMSIAIAGGRSFNIIDYATLDKVDIFVMADQPWSRQQLQRRRLEPLPNHPDATMVYFASPEDVVLSKLAWYRRGGEVSDRQWLDILNVLALQADSLDWAYLRHWASELGVSDLLVRASAQSEPGSTVE